MEKMGRPAKWKSKTVSIRIPAHLAEHLLNVAKQLEQLEQPESFVQNSETQTSLLTYDGRRFPLTLTQARWQEAEDLANLCYQRLLNQSQKVKEQVLVRLCDQVLQD